MDISWLGHACFRIKGKNSTVVTDPFSPGLGYPPLTRLSASIVTVSHDHPGHNYLEGVRIERRQVVRPGEYEIGGVLIVGISTFHDNQKGARHGRNIVFLIHLDDLTVLHLGDLGHLLTTEQMEQIEDVDVMLVPVGGGSTLDAAAAAATVRQIEPKLVVPMHFGLPPADRGLAPVSRFLKEMGLKEIEPRPRLNVTRSNLPQDTQVVLLQY